MNTQEENAHAVAFAQQLLTLLGGEENITSISHCTTRLRFALVDQRKVDSTAIQQMDGVYGTFTRLGLFQIILSSGFVNKVYREMIDLDKTREAHEGSKIRGTKRNPLVILAKTLSDIFIPIIPVVVASGLLMGLITLMNVFQWISPDSTLFILVDTIYHTIFLLLPILIGFVAAKTFGGSPVLGAVMGGILNHPVLLNQTKFGGELPESMHLLGLDISLRGYEGTFVPILVAVFLMSKVERSLAKVVPQSLHLFFIPLISIMSIGMFSLLVIGPMAVVTVDMVTSLLEFSFHQGGIATGLLFGGLYSGLVITGLHHSIHAIEMELLANPQIGQNFLLPIWSMANVAQGGAGLAVYMKTKNERLKKIALPSAFSAFLGIVEPVIFGVNLKLVKPFIGAAIGGAIGGLYVVLSQVTANSYGLTGIPMFAIVAPMGLTNTVNYLIGFILATLTAFLTTWMLWTREAEVNIRSLHSNEGEVDDYENKKNTK